MDISKLYFFNKKGENINFTFNSDLAKYESTIYFDKLSSALFDNENLYILEKIGNNYVYPTFTSTQQIEFKWKTIDDEDNIFLYDIEFSTADNNDYLSPKTEILIEYDPSLNGDKIPLNINIAFNPINEINYERVLEIHLIDNASPASSQVIGEISFYGEGIDEDERYKVWLANFGIKFNREDALILKDYDIKEALPDWNVINQKRKEALLTRGEIYPYIGTYKGLSNIINFLGFKDFLSVKEYWQNKNVDSAYFEKFTLIDISDLLDNGKIDSIDLNTYNYGVKYTKEFRKTGLLGLFYKITDVTGEEDDDGIPIVERTTPFTNDEILYKLSKLKEKIKNEILPINVKVIDIVGEFIFFQKFSIRTWNNRVQIKDLQINETYDIETFPLNGTEPYLYDIRPLLKQINKSTNNLDFGTFKFNESNSNPYEWSQKYPISDVPLLIESIRTFYSEIQQTKKTGLNNPIPWDYGDDPEVTIGCPIIFNVKFNPVTWDLLFSSTWDSLEEFYTWDTIDYKSIYEIEWNISKKTGTPYNFTYRGFIKDLHTLPHFLPYEGEYDVLVKLYDLNAGHSINYENRIILVNKVEPEIIALSRIEDKFNNTWDELHNVTWDQVESSYWYNPVVNITNQNNNEIDLQRNLYEWDFYKDRILDAKIFNEETFIYENLTTSDHHLKNLYGIPKRGGSEVFEWTWDDFENATWDELFHMKWYHTVYHTDFLAGFFIKTTPKKGDTIRMNKYSDFIFKDIILSQQDAVDELNDSDHSAISLFRYEVQSYRKKYKISLIQDNNNNIYEFNINNSNILYVAPANQDIKDTRDELITLINNEVTQHVNAIASTDDSLLIIADVAGDDYDLTSPSPSLITIRLLQECGPFIHATAKDFGKDNYVIIEYISSGDDDETSPFSPRNTNLLQGDKYSYYEPIWIYDRSKLTELDGKHPAFDIENLFVEAPYQDIVTGKTNNIQYWIDNKFIYQDTTKDIQKGFIPSLFDTNVFNLTQVKLYEDSFIIPKWAPIFFVINNIPGKTEFVWTLYDEDGDKKLIQIKDVPFFIWRFSELGQYRLEVQVTDNRGNIYNKSFSRFINVKSKDEYIQFIERKIDKLSGIIL